jgi:cytochrome c-type biogenesis protein CcmH/NrfG
VQAFARDELDIFAAKHVAFARCEVPEGHFERAADFWFQMMHSADKAVGRKPFRERVRLEERAIDFLWAGCQNAVQAYGVGHTRLSL